MIQLKLEKKSKFSQLVAMTQLLQQVTEISLQCVASCVRVPLVCVFHQHEKMNSARLVFSGVLEQPGLKLVLDPLVLFLCENDRIIHCLCVPILDFETKNSH